MVFALSLLCAFPAAAREKADACANKTLSAIAKCYKLPGLRAAGPGGPGRVVAHACTPSPYGTDALLAAVAYSRSPAKVAPGSREMGLAVAMLDRAGERVISGHLDASLTEDVTFMLGETSLRIDDARYELAPGVRAFGVVIDSAGYFRNCADTDTDSEFMLWIREGETLRAVMGTNLWGAAGVDGGLCPSPGRPNPRAVAAKLTVGVEKTVTSGFADLSLTAVAYLVKPPRVLARTLLKYDGNSYGVNMNRTFWYPEAVKARIREAQRKAANKSSPARSSMATASPISREPGATLAGDLE
jgi:hypothetical protein